ncbi:MAG: hypothetical protein OHK0056_29060 [Bacteriovoracaceae bacterium]
MSNNKTLILQSANKLKKRQSSSNHQLSIEEAKRFDMEARRLAIKKLDLENEELAGIISLRKLYADKILSFAKIWSFITVCLIILNGFKICGFLLEKEVLITLIGTTIGNVFALALVVARGVFTNHRA